MYILLIATPIFCFISYYLISNYTLGDQEKYRALYDSLAGVYLYEIPFLQFRYTGSAEPLYGLIMWMGSNAGIDKDVYITVFNCIFFITLFVFLLKNHASPIFIALIYLNFYFIVLLTGAERLKFAYLALLLVPLMQLRWSKALFFSGSFFSHFSSLLIWLGISAQRVAYIKISSRVKLRIISKVFFTLLFGLSSIAVLMFFLGDRLISKIEYYWLAGNIASLLNISVLFVLTFFVFKNKLPIFFSLIFCSILIYLFGPERTNMIATTVFLYHAITENKTNNPFVLMLMLYFAIKSFSFIEKIIIYGNGFANI